MGSGVQVVAFVISVFATGGVAGVWQPAASTAMATTRNSLFIGAIFQQLPRRHDRWPTSAIFMKLPLSTVTGAVTRDARGGLESRVDRRVLR